jgi:hypothetical protein
MAYGWILYVIDEFQFNSEGCRLEEEREMPRINPTLDYLALRRNLAQFEHHAQ